MDDNPLRTFLVHLSPLVIEGVVVAPARDETVQAHLPNVMQDGCLQLLHYSGGIPWTVRIYPPGMWVGVDASVPTPADCEQMQAVAAQESARKAFLEAPTGKTRH